MSKTTLEWAQEVERCNEQLVALRRDFHKHPELSFQEHRTARIIAERLDAAGLEVRTGVGGPTGVVGVLRGDKPGRTIAWRADTDALPVAELFDAPFASATPGTMHACGHDGHTAIAISLAEILAARRAQLPGTAVFLFQPAEEVFGGAKPMIDARALEDPRVDEVYGLHLVTLIPAGHVGVRAGPTMASVDFFDVEIQGKGGHGAFPHLSVDPITVAANIVLGMQNLVSREVVAHEPSVLTVGQIVAGTKHNIIPASAVMRGSLRAYSRSVRDQLAERFGVFASSVARAYRAEAHVHFHGGCPAVVNHPGQTTLVERCAVDALGSGAVAEAEPIMASDDMSLFLQERPGCYFFVGVAPPRGTPPPHHAPEFEMNEAGLAVGLRLALGVMLGAQRGD